MQRGIVLANARSTLGLALIIVLGALGGCVANGGDESILVLKNVVADATCTASSSSAEVGLSHGRLDLLLPSGYLFIAQLKSRITALTGQEDQRTIITSGARVDITFPNSTVFSAAELADLRSSGLTHFKQLFSVVISPNGGIADAPFDLIPVDLVDRIAAKTTPSAAFRMEAVATFTVDGDMSGQGVTSQAFTYAITIGNGVGVNITGLCSDVKAGFVARTGYACNPAQDGVVDCCVSGSRLVCPAAAP